jgi:polysaccharide export outer membrane protein
MKRLIQAVLAAFMLLASTGSAWAADVLGAGDLIKISVYGNPDLTMETRINDNNAITFPLIGRVTVGGQPVAVAEKNIAKALESGGYLKNPQVTIYVTQVQSQQVSVMGHVNRPGRYPLEGGKRSLVDVLAQAGGIGQDGGDIVSVVRKRDGKTTREQVDVVQMVRTGEFNNNYELNADDVVYVERAPRFYIYGEVQRPGPVRLERGMTVTQALSAGGGLTLRGTERGLTIKRRGADGAYQTIKARAEDQVQVDDVVYVKESWF